MNPRRVLAIAEWVCGERARRDVFEPLIADWQRELREARRGWRYAIAVLSGAAAFIVSLGRCFVADGSWVPTSRAAGGSFLAFIFALDAAAALLLILELEAGRPVDVGSIQTQFYLLSMLAVTIPVGLLPALFVMRRDPNSTTRHAIGGLVLGTLLTATVVEMTAQESLNDYFSTFAASERQYQRNLANDRAGRYQYPGTALRQLRGPTTTEQRREAYRKFTEWRQRQEASQRPMTLQPRLRRQQPALFAFLLGMMGWTLAGLGTTSLRRAWLWWILMLGAMLALNGTLSSALRSSVRPPFWLALPTLAAVTMLLVAQSWRLPSGRDT
jgi:hypothetical protein